MVLALSFITAAFVMIGKPVEGEAAGKLAAPKITGKSSSVKTVTLKWDSVSGADGYRIYVYNKTKKKYKICGTVSASTNIFEKSKDFFCVHWFLI